MTHWDVEETERMCRRKREAWEQFIINELCQVRADTQEIKFSDQSDGFRVQKGWANDGMILEIPFNSLGLWTAVYKSVVVLPIVELSYWDGEWRVRLRELALLLFALREAEFRSKVVKPWMPGGVAKAFWARGIIPSA